MKTLKQSELKKIIESDIWTEQPFSKGQAWIDLATMDEQPGIRGLSRRWGWNHVAAIRFLRQLQSAKHIKLEDDGTISFPRLANKPKKEPEPWKTSFDHYLNELRSEFVRLTSDSEFMRIQAEVNPKIDVYRSMEKACVNFWATKKGWDHKKKKRSKTIDWESTLKNAITMPSNKVWVNK